MRKTRRGRPPLNREINDKGTPELQRKRKAQLTAEPLDICLAKGLIDSNQHWCGIHLRWLYTLRFGAPGVRAVDPTHLGGMDIRLRNPEWRYEREQEYVSALQALQQAGCEDSVLDVCVFNHLPGHLRLMGKTHASRREMRELQEGLTLLARMWCGARGSALRKVTLAP